MRQLQFIWGLCGLLVAGLAVPLVGWVYSHELPAVYWLWVCFISVETAC